MKYLSTLTQRDQNSFGVVRLFAALAVIVSHSFLLVSSDATLEPLSQSTSFSLGAHAVHVFFTLSGFLIASSWARKPDTIHFLAGRFVRIMPALVVITSTIIVVSAFLQTETKIFPFLASTDTMIFFLRTVVAFDGGGTLRGVFTNNPQDHFVIATAWTIRYEVICYVAFLFPAVAALQKKNIFYIATGIILACTILILVTRGRVTEEMVLIDHLARFFLSFYLGVGAWVMRGKLPLSFLGVLALFLIAWFATGSAISMVSQIIFVGYLTLWLGSLNFGKLRNITEREDLSYGIYLMGYPIQQFWVQTLPENQPALLNIYLTLLVVLPLAFLSWRLIERPAIRQRSNLIRLLGLIGLKSAGKPPILKNKPINPALGSSKTAISNLDSAF